MEAATIDMVETVVIEQDTARLDEAAKIISSGVKWSAASAVIPVTGLDLLGIAAVQVNMVGDLSNLYGTSLQKESIRGIVSALIGTLLPSTASQAVVSSSAKWLPGYGTIVGIVSLGAFASAATYAIGKIFVKHFEGGGTLANFSAEAVKDDLRKEFKKASK
jgi:uncharacterized protein (DUF697 family)